MTYKETLYFVAKCLTISLEHKNRDEIEKQLQSNNIDWDAVVKVSTAHYVFPALYCNMQRANFLHYLPKELVTYMEHITNLNRERNEEIITQARELNTLLLANNISIELCWTKLCGLICPLINALIKRRSSIKAARLSAIEKSLTGLSFGLANISLTAARALAITSMICGSMGLLKSCSKRNLLWLW